MSPSSNRVLSTPILATWDAPEAAKDDINGLAKAMCLLSIGSVGLGIIISWAYKAAETRRYHLGQLLAIVYLGPYKKNCYGSLQIVEIPKPVSSKILHICPTFSRESIPRIVY